jgi:hypothetical protein
VFLVRKACRIGRGSTRAWYGCGRTSSAVVSWHAGLARDVALEILERARRTPHARLLTRERIDRARRAWSLGVRADGAIGADGACHAIGREVAQEPYRLQDSRVGECAARTGPRSARSFYTEIARCAIAACGSAGVGCELTSSAESAFWGARQTSKRSRSTRSFRRGTACTCRACRAGSAVLAANKSFIAQMCTRLAARWQLNRATRRAHEASSAWAARGGTAFRLILATFTYVAPHAARSRRVRPWLANERLRGSRCTEVARRTVVAVCSRLRPGLVVEGSCG